MTYVYVLNKQGKPLMPTTRCGHIRKLLKSNKAVVVKSNPFTIKLKYDTPNGIQDLFVGIDSGRENIGLGVSDIKGNCVYLGELYTNNKSIKRKMQERANFRSERRKHHRQNKQRKACKDNTAILKGNASLCRNKIECKSVYISYPAMSKAIEHKIIRGKESKFANRKRELKWMTPSARQCVQMHLNFLKHICSLLPINNVTLEKVCFDFQKLDNPNIKVNEYSKGCLYGFNSYKDYIYAEQHGKCLICGTNSIDEYHHIHQKKCNGTDVVTNIAGLCKKCHNKVHTDQIISSLLETLKKGQSQKYSVELLNSAMPEIINQLNNFCTRNKINFKLCDGFETSDIRNQLNLKKDHYIDGYCISIVNRNIKNLKIKTDIVHIYQRYKKKSKNYISKNNFRAYYFDNKLVAKNRHKAIDQKEDSLSEYMCKYSKTHTTKECQKHFANLTIKPANRIYTYHRTKQISTIHPGDIVKYERHLKNGTMMTDIFVATNVIVATSKVQSILDNMPIKAKKLKFCKRICSGNMPCIGVRKLS